MEVFAFVTLLIAILARSGAVNRTASVECYDNGDDFSMVFTVTSNSDSNLAFVYAINSTDDKIDQCSSNSPASLFTTAPDLSEFKITINVTKDYVPDVDCGHINNTADVFEWRFFTTKNENILVRSIDVLYVASCNFSEASSTVVNTGAITVTGNLVENAAKDETISFVLNLVDPSGHKYYTVGLGDRAKLEIIQQTGRAVNVTGHSCIASPDGNFGNSDYLLIDSNGCPVDTGDGASQLASGFAGGYRSSESGEFEQFKFLKSDSVYYRCTVVYCFTGDSSCDDYCAFNGGQKRAKREADDLTQTEIAETVIRISLDDVPAVNDRPACPPEVVENLRSAQPVPQDAPSCLNNTGVIAAFGAMGAMLILTAFVALLVYLRSAKLSRTAKSI